MVDASTLAFQKALDKHYPMSPFQVTRNQDAPQNGAHTYLSQVVDFPYPERPVAAYSQTTSQ